MVAWFLLMCAVAGVKSTQGSDVIRVTSLLTAPYLMLNESSVYYGMVVDILNNIQRISDVNFQLSLVSDSKFGTFSNGTWNGMIGELIDDKADLIAAPLVFTLKREKYIDFTVPFQSSQAYILLNKRRPPQGPTISGLSDLANQNGLQYGIVEYGGLKEKMNSSTDNDVQTLIQTMFANPGWMKPSNQDGVYTVRRNANYAFIMEGSSARYIAGLLPCDLDIVPTDFYHRQYAFAVRNVSPLRDVINEALVNLRESGELERIEEKWWYGECGAAARNGDAGVAVVAVVALFGALLSR